MDSFISSDNYSDSDSPGTPSSVNDILRLLQSHHLSSKIESAKQIRRLSKTSERSRRHFSSAINQLVHMLTSDSLECAESALLALLNLAVRDERNKISIVDAGALEPIVGFLHSESPNMQEHATATLLTLSACSANKPRIVTSGVIPLLGDILRYGSMQAQVDAVMALYNLSTNPEYLKLILRAEPVPSVVNLLKTCKKSSKLAEKCSALIESLIEFNEARTALMSEEGGVLAIVEVLESGSLQSREHAVGTLLTMCEIDRCKYREPILREGVIPGLLELTVQGTPKSQLKAQTLLKLLRDSPYPRSDIQAETLENIVCNLISQIDVEEQSGKAKQMLSEMVQVSMEQSLRHLQQRAMVCTPDMPISNCASEVSSK